MSAGEFIFGVLVNLILWGVIHFAFDPGVWIALGIAAVITWVCVFWGVSLLDD
jgi:hypothetical protein